MTNLNLVEDPGCQMGYDVVELDLNRIRMDHLEKVQQMGFDKSLKGGHMPRFGERKKSKHYSNLGIAAFLLA